MSRIALVAAAIAARRSARPLPPHTLPPDPPPDPTPALRAFPDPPTAPTTGQITTELTTSHSVSQINAAISGASPGDVIALRGGSYAIGGNLSFEAVGNEGAPITVCGYPGETVVLDFAGAGAGSRIWMNGARWMIVRDLEVRNAKSHTFYLTGQDGKDPASDNRFVNIVMRNGALTGWAVVRGSRNRIWHSLAIWTASVSDPGNADGFGPGGQVGYSEDNGCYGCVAVNAPDDGFDTWQSYRTELLACTSVRAGNYGGDGNGFKLGRGLPPEGAWTHATQAEWYLARALVRACLAVDSASHGFDSNTGADSDVLHNTAIGSGAHAFNFPRAGGNPTALPDGNAETNLLRNNLALGGVSIHSATAAIAVTNSWQGSPAIVAGDFDDLTAPPASAFNNLTGRQAFDLLETGAYAALGRPAAGSTPIGAATDLGYGLTLGAR